MHNHHDSLSSLTTALLDANLEHGMVDATKLDLNPTPLDVSVLMSSLTNLHLHASQIQWSWV